MKRDCFYELTVTIEKPIKNDYFLGKKVDKWYVGYFEWKDVLQYVNEWYNRGADAVELKMLTEEEFLKELQSGIDKKVIS